MDLDRFLREARNSGCTVVIVRPPEQAPTTAPSAPRESSLASSREEAGSPTPQPAAKAAIAAPAASVAGKSLMQEAMDRLLQRQDEEVEDMDPRMQDQVVAFVPPNGAGSPMDKFA